MQQDEFDRWLRDTASSYNEPPTPDLAKLWPAIDASRVQSTRTRLRALPWWQQSWVRMAAVLIVGVALGRVSGSVGRPTVTSPTSMASVGSASPAVLATRVLDAPDAERYLGQTVALLSSLQSDAMTTRSDTMLAARASRLLSTTRFLLDSPDADDPNVRGLLEDLELVLVQIVQIPSTRSASDVELIHQALKQRDVMPRLRSAVANLNPAD